VNIVFDQGTPVPLRRALVGHEIATAFELGWSQLKNGDLLNAAEGRFDLLVTTDQSLQHEQRLTGRKLAILVLPTTSWPEIQRHTGVIIDAVDAIQPGELRELAW